jgi:hypothetical protein
MGKRSYRDILLALNVPYFVISIQLRPLVEGCDAPKPLRLNWVRHRIRAGATFLSERDTPFHLDGTPPRGEQPVLCAATDRMVY